MRPAAQHGVLTMAEDEQRAAVVAEARSWVGTKYHHAANLKGVGVDCAFLLIEAFADAGVIEHFDPRPYSKDWFLHRDEERYVGLILKCGGREITGQAPKPADVAVWRVGRLFAHGGIVTEWPRVVHAYAKEKLVIETDVSREPIANNPKHPMRLFSMWD